MRLRKEGEKMKKMELQVEKKRGVVASIVIIFCLVLLTFLGAGNSVAKELKIGALLARTGWWAAAYDSSILAMTQVAVDMINETGGIAIGGDRYKINLVVADTKSTFDGVAAATNKLVYDERVRFIVGPTGFFVSPATPITTPAKVIMVIGWHVCMPNELDKNTPWNIGTSHGSLTKALAVLKSIRRDYPHIKRIVWASPDDGAIPYLVPKLKKLATDLGFVVQGEVISFPNEMEDFSPIVTKMLAQRGFEAVFIDRAPPPALGSMVKLLREAGFKGPIFSGSPISTAEVAQIAGKDATEGVRTPIETPDDPAMPAVMAKMAKRIIEKYGRGYPLSYQCATGVFLLKTLLESAGSADPEVIIEKFRKMDTMDTIYGKGIVCGKETFGIRHLVATPVPIQKYEKGKAVPAGWVDIGYIP